MPPNTKESWDECGADTKSWMIAYSQLRDYEESDEKLQLVKAGMRM